MVIENIRIGDVVVLTLALLCLEVITSRVFDR